MTQVAIVGNKISVGVALCKDKDEEWAEIKINGQKYVWKDGKLEKEEA